jgi:hypothetical protein
LVAPSIVAFAGPHIHHAAPAAPASATAPININAMMVLREDEVDGTVEGNGIAPNAVRSGSGKEGATICADDAVGVALGSADAATGVGLIEIIVVSSARPAAMALIAAGGNRKPHFAQNFAVGLLGELH